MTTGYHYKGERMKRRNAEAHFRRTFGPWLNEQLRLVEEKRQRREKFTDDDIALLTFSRAMARRGELAA